MSKLIAWQMDHWIDGCPGIGLATSNYYGFDFISLFWGDDNTNLIRAFDQKWAAVEAGLEEAYI
jgi:hypothetical protein